MHENEKSLKKVEKRILDAENLKYVPYQYKPFILYHKNNMLWIFIMMTLIHKQNPQMENIFISKLGGVFAEKELLIILPLCKLCIWFECERRYFKFMLST